VTGLGGADGEENAVRQSGGERLAALAILLLEVGGAPRLATHRRRRGGLRGQRRQAEGRGERGEDD
jgi:hypothetical protein